MRAVALACLSFAVVAEPEAAIAHDIGKALSKSFMPTASAAKSPAHAVSATAPVPVGSANHVDSPQAAWNGFVEMEREIRNLALQNEAMKVEVEHMESQIEFLERARAPQVYGKYHSWKLFGALMSFGISGLSLFAFIQKVVSSRQNRNGSRAAVGAPRPFRSPAPVMQFGEPERKGITTDTEPDEFFTTNFDGMSDGEKIKSPVVIGGVALIVIPFIVAAFVLLYYR